jgi:thiamine-phosphate pyrophosphorylase
MIPRPRPDWSLYLVTDRTLLGKRHPEKVVAAAVAGGVTAVQLREKNLPDREFIGIAARLKALLRPLGVPLIVNDRPDVALASEADGVHLGQRDSSPAEARRILGPGALIGLSVETEIQAKEAGFQDIDYLGVSAVFATPTKADTATIWGLDGLRRLRLLTRHPLVAIGGINASNVAAVIEAGADGVAVVSAILGAESPEEAARDLLRKIKEARLSRNV